MYEWEATVSTSGADLEKVVVRFETEQMLSTEHLAEKAGNAGSTDGVSRRHVWLIKPIRQGMPMPSPVLNPLEGALLSASKKETEKKIGENAVNDAFVRLSFERLGDMLAATYGVAMSLRSKTDEIHKRLDEIERELALRKQDA